jgi:hypothetical protein
VAALVADEIEPLLVTILLRHPAQPARVEGDQTVVALTEHSSADATPSFRVLAVIVPIAAENPDHRVRAPARDDVLCDADTIVDTQFPAWVGLEECPEQHGGRHEAMLDRGFDPCVEPAEQGGVDPDGVFFFDKRDLAERVRRAAAPLGAHELDRREALGTASAQVALPVLRP